MLIDGPHFPLVSSKAAGALRRDEPAPELAPDPTPLSDSPAAAYTSKRHRLRATWATYRKHTAVCLRPLRRDGMLPGGMQAAQGAA